jgi:hypothetical protein
MDEGLCCKDTIDYSSQRRVQGIVQKRPFMCVIELHRVPAGLVQHTTRIDKECRRICKHLYQVSTNQVYAIPNYHVVCANTYYEYMTTKS